MPVASWRTQAILLLYWSQLGLRFWLVLCHFLLRFRVAQCDGDAGCSGMLNGTISVRWIFDLLEFFFVHYIIIVNVCYRIWSWYVFWVCSPVDKAYSGADVWPRSQCEADRMRSWSLHVGFLDVFKTTATSLASQDISKFLLVKLYPVYPPMYYALYYHSPKKVVDNIHYCIRYYGSIFYIAPACISYYCCNFH